MNPELFEQRKEALRYNQERNCLLSSLCGPLKTYLDIDLFVHAIFHLNSQGEATGYHVLGTNVEYVGVCLFRFNDNGKSYTQAIKETPLNSYSYFLWPNGDNCPLIQVLCHEFFILKGIAIYKRCKDYIEGWGFGSKNSNGIPNIVTQTSVSPFHDFINYFENQQTVNQFSSPIVNYPESFDMSYIQPNTEQMKDFKNSIFRNKFALDIGHKSIVLTKREWECLSEIAQGKTYKGVASSLSLSPRTVEAYLNQIREKTGISHKSKLIDRFLANNQFVL
ncbi:MAG: helix-turn-helix transcriptional regulator [Alphaproteobacteria bacterium]|nr:helix-turn-helix transcriptional regulator [Alphaproteobacteria bacterium]